MSIISFSFIFFAIILGLILRKFKLPSFVNSLIAIGLLLASILIGLRFPLYLSSDVWQIVIFVYVAVACIAPVWILLQPRDYLNSFLLIAMIISAVIGILVANPKMNLDAFSGCPVGGQTMFPYLFVTVACAVYFRRTKRQGAFLWAPMAFMLVTTLVTLVLTVKSCITSVAAGTAASIAGAVVQGLFAIAIFILEIIVAGTGLKKLRAKPQDVPMEEEEAE